jgi:hypothetical protein
MNGRSAHSASIRKDRDQHLRRNLQHWSILVIALTNAAVTLHDGAAGFDVHMNAALVSLVLLLSTAFELAGLHVWQDAAEFLCGLWIAAAPAALGYAEVGELRYWHVALGTVLVLLATVNILKDSKLARRNSCKRRHGNAANKRPYILSRHSHP